MVQTMVETVAGLVDAYVNTSLGHVIASVMLFGTSVALFRWMESGAGGRNV